MKLNKRKKICSCSSCATQSYVQSKPKYSIRTIGYDIREFTYAEYYRIRKKIKKEEDFDIELYDYEYCVTSKDHDMMDSWGWNSIDNLIIASYDGESSTVELDIVEEIESGTTYADIKQRIDIIVDIGNAIMNTLNKRK